MQKKQKEAPWETIIFFSMLAFIIGLIIGYTWCYKVLKHNNELSEKLVPTTQEKCKDNSKDKGIAENTNLLKTVGYMNIIFGGKDFYPTYVGNWDYLLITEEESMSDYFTPEVYKTIIETCNVPHTLDNDGQCIPTIHPGDIIQTAPPKYRKAHQVTLEQLEQQTYSDEYQAPSLIVRDSAERSIFVYD